MEMRTSGEVEMRIDAAPSLVYDLVSDVTRIGEWSPECRRCEWVDGATGPEVGARFRGYNRSGAVRWSRLVEVVRAVPGGEFVFRTLPDRFNKDSTTWWFRLEEDDGATVVTHGYEISAMPAFPVNVIMRLFLRHHADMRPQMLETLGGLKDVAER